MGSTVSRAAFQPPKPGTPVRTRNLSRCVRTVHIPFDLSGTRVAVPAVYIRRDNHAHLQSDDRDEKERRLTLLFSHGNAEDVGAIMNWMFELSERLNVDVLAYDYPGYGVRAHEMPDSHVDVRVRRVSAESHAGKDREEVSIETTAVQETPVVASMIKDGCDFVPSEAATFAAAHAAYDFLVDEQNVRPRDLIVFGRSVGSGPTCELASTRPVAGVILQSPLRSAIRVVTNSSITAHFDIFKNQDKVKRFTAPVFVFHGRQDEVINLSHGQHLYDQALKHGLAYGDDGWWIEGCGHNDIEELVFDEYFERLRGFLRFVEAREGDPLQPQEERWFSSFRSVRTH